MHEVMQYHHQRRKGSTKHPFYNCGVSYKLLYCTYSLVWPEAAFYILSSFFVRATKKNGKEWSGHPRLLYVG